MRKVAIHGLLTILSIFILFHVLVLTRVIPYNIVWGGRLTDLSQMYIFEIISVIINTIFLFIVLIKSKLLEINLSDKLLNSVLWIMAGLFLLNTLGNLLSNNNFEKLVFTPITLLLSIFSITLIVKKNDENRTS
jgi:hypothetical protein